MKRHPREVTWCTAPGNSIRKGRAMAGIVGLGEAKGKT